MLRSLSSANRQEVGANAHGYPAVTTYPVQRHFGDGAPVQMTKRLEDFLQAVVEYIYLLDGQAWGADASAGIAQQQELLTGIWLGLDEKERGRLEDEADFYGVCAKVDPELDPDLIYQHAKGYYRPAVDAVELDEEVVDFHQEHFAGPLKSKPSRNIASALVDITIYDSSAPSRKGFLRKAYANRSGSHDISTKVSAPGPSSFDVNYNVGPNEDHGDRFWDHHDRHVDSEVPIVNQILADSGYAIKAAKIVHPVYDGTIIIYSDRPTCQSCTELMLSLTEAFKNSVEKPQRVYVKVVAGQMHS